MNIIYLTRTLSPVSVTCTVPGDTHMHPDYGECRRLTAKRFCLVRTRAGIESDAFQGLLKAVCEHAYDGMYDGRSIEYWYGLVGLDPPEPEMVKVKCPECGAIHYALKENGKIWENGVCGECWSKHFFIA